MIIITGASRGLGSQIFNHYNSIGKTIIGTYNKTKPEAHNADNMVQVDVSSPAQVESFVAGIHIELENIVLINCAGSSYNSFAHKADLESWINVVNINLIGSFLMIHFLLPVMRKQNFGRIINFSSVLSRMGVPGTSAYSSSKAGLNGLVKCLSKENGSKGITVNNINLGYFDTGMIDQVDHEHKSNIIRSIPSGRLGNYTDIIRVIDCLIDTPYINGASLDLNGALL